MSYLNQRHGQPTWHFERDFPAPLREVIGQRRLVKSLGTHDLAMARSLRAEALAEWERTVREARAKTGTNDLVERGLAWRKRMERISAGDRRAIVNSFGTDPSWQYAGPDRPPLTEQEAAAGYTDHALDALADDLRDSGRGPDAAVLLDVAYGRATPLLHYVDAWLAEGGRKGPLQPRTALQYRSDLARLDTWCRAAGIPVTVEAITPRIAGRYITETMVAREVDPNTGNRWISAASTYWRWMGRRAGVEANPWTNQSLAKAAAHRTGERAKRPFTDGEMALLLSGDPGEEMADAIRVAALSGMRREEVYRLTVADCAAGWFDVRESKTAAGVRRVPVHSGLSAIVARRVDGKAARDFLFHEAGVVRPNRQRSDAMGKRFGRYRQAQGVHSAREDRRQSAVDFHSLRRWFITTARNARQDRAMVAAVVGHEAGNITDDVYSAGPSDDLRKAVVESVKLPTAPN